MAGDDPVRDAMRAAFQALLRGDTAERDLQIARARAMMQLPKPDFSREQIISSLLEIGANLVERPLTKEESAAIQRNPADMIRYLNRIGYKL